MPEDEDHIDLKGWSLHRAARENRTDIARYLIARGGDIDASTGLVLESARKVIRGE